MVAEQTHTKTQVRKIATAWHVTCPCGFTWTTDHHRLAVMFAIEHEHQRAA